MKKLKVILFLVVTFTLACSKEDPSGWYLDPHFSKQLISYWHERFGIPTKDDPAKPVDVLQIFRAPRDKRIFTVNEIRTQQWVYETRDSLQIVALFRAARIESNERCDIAETDYEYFVLGFDRNLMRVGIVKYFPCEREDLGWFQTWGSNSAYFSSEFAKMMHKIIPPNLQKQGKK